MKFLRRGSPTRDTVVARRTAVESTYLTVGNHIRFDTLLVSRGNKIILDTTSPYTTNAGASIGRVKLKKGYK